MAKPITVTSENFNEQVLQSAMPVLVDFWAAWCGPCRLLAPVVEALAVEYDGRFLFAKLDVDANPDLALAYGVEGIPTLLLFFGGQEIARFIGYMSKEQLARRLEAALPVVAWANDSSRVVLSGRNGSAGKENNW